MNWFPSLMIWPFNAVMTLFLLVFVFVFFSTFQAHLTCIFHFTFGTIIRQIPAVWYHSTMHCFGRVCWSAEGSVLHVSD